MFPSPYGVSFILTQELLKWLKASNNLVSVSLWSIIHSYEKINLGLGNLGESFRLLTEYHSFLLEKIFGVNYKEYQFPSPYEVIFTFILYYKRIVS